MTKRELLAIRCRRRNCCSAGQPIQRSRAAQLERAGLPADQCEPGLAVHRDMAQAFADDAVKR